MVPMEAGHIVAIIGGKYKKNASKKNRGVVLKVTKAMVRLELLDGSQKGKEVRIMQSSVVRLYDDDGCPTIHEKVVSMSPTCDENEMTRLKEQLKRVLLELNCFISALPDTSSDVV